MDFTGCGNTLNMRHPRVLQLVMDSLRYWVTEMHVDGFRFDLASALARELFEVDKLASFFDIIHQDPILSQVKLIAEPWDVGQGGYQVGNFSVLWTVWNGKYRDAVRRFWRGDGGAVSEFATRLCGSSDLYEASGRRAYASINFITCHDGYPTSEETPFREIAVTQANRKRESAYVECWPCLQPAEMLRVPNLAKADSRPRTGASWSPRAGGRRPSRARRWLPYAALIGTRSTHTCARMAAGGMTPRI
jgi:hypothetical protein